MSQHSSPNPVSLEQTEQLRQWILKRLPPKPDWLSTCTAASSPESAITRSKAEIVGIGGPTCLFRLMQEALGGTQDSFTAADARRAIEENVDKDDDWLAARYPQPKMVLPKMVLLSTVMEHAGFDSVRYEEAVGSCPGVLVSATYWEKS